MVILLEKKKNKDDKRIKMIQEKREKRKEKREKRKEKREKRKEKRENKH